MSHILRWSTLLLAAWSITATRPAAAQVVPRDFIYLGDELLVYQANFTDVPPAHEFYGFVNIVANNGVTAGCGNRYYCPDADVSREQMPVFVLRAKEGPAYVPPQCSPPNIFADVPETSPYCRWIEELASRGVVSGCGGGNYCPTASVNREQMAVFLLRTLTPGMTLPPCAPPNLFTDVPETSGFCPWVEEVATRGFMRPCAAGLFCPANPVKRGPMAEHIALTFGLQ